MSASVQSKNHTTTTRVAVLGNPNTGKSTLFNRLTGIHQQTANYPRVTIERHTGYFQFGDRQIELIDLPGTYSLTPRSPEEVITVNVLLGISPADSPPDVILCVVDASNLQRNLFLVSQALDLNLPIVIAVNMIDIAESQGQAIDVQSLSSTLGVPAVAIQANKGIGLDQLKQAIVESANRVPAVLHNPFPAEWERHIDELAARFENSKSKTEDQQRLAPFARFAAARMLFDTDGYLIANSRATFGDELAALAKEKQSQLHLNQSDAASAEADLRFKWIEDHAGKAVTINAPDKTTFSDRVDRWLTHPIWGLIIVGVVLVAVFQAVFKMADPASSAIGWFTGWFADLVNRFIPEGAFNSLLVDGLIEGVGGVLVFLPQILLLFLILAVLEDSGYLARAAFLLDRFLSKLGLSGITLFPLLSSFACAIPGIMASRVIADHRERMITILIAPLMSCSARLPVYILMISAFVPETSYMGGLLGLRGLVMLSMYLVGIVVAIAVAWILKKTLFKSPSSTFVMELPTYKLPSIRNVVRRMFDGGWAFVRDAGTIIVVVTILVWAAMYFPRAEELPANLTAQKSALEAQLSSLDEEADKEAVADLESQINGIEEEYQLRQSFLGRAGHAIEPIVKPLGWDWRIGSAAIASFPAREVVVATMSVIFGMGGNQNEESPMLRQALQDATWDGTGEKLFTLPVALSLMVFFALCAQCVSTLAVIRRETNSWKWPIFTFVYMTVLAYVAALIVYQVGSRI